MLAEGAAPVFAHDKDLKEDAVPGQDYHLAFGKDGEYLLGEHAPSKSALYTGKGKVEASGAR